MEKIAVRKLIASLSILAYVGMGSGLADQFVYCVGAGGHSAVERVHVAAACSAEWQDANQRASAETTTISSCTDMPLLAPTFNEQETVSRAFASPLLHVAYCSYSETSPAPRAFASDFHLSDIQDSPSRRTTIRRV